MAPNDRNKLGLSLPIDPRWKGSDGSLTNSSATNMTSLSQRSAVRSPRPNIPPPPPPRPMEKTAAPALEREEAEQLQRLESAPRTKKLSKQLSMQETRRDIAWEKRRKQILRQEKRRRSIAAIPAEGENFTDEDLSELRGSIELGFGFSDEAGQKLSDILPALDFYLAVNRQLSLSPVSTPRSRLSPTSSTGGQSSTLGSPSSDDSWRICGPGDSPKQVKAKLRHWAQAVACSVMQSL